MGVRILLPGDSLCALQVPLPWLRCLPGESASVCGDTWLGSDLSTGRGIFGAASLRHVGEESVLGGVSEFCEDVPCVMLSALVRGRLWVLSPNTEGGDSGGGRGSGDRGRRGGGAGVFPGSHFKLCEGDVSSGASPQPWDSSPCGLLPQPVRHSPWGLARHEGALCLGCSVSAMLGLGFRAVLLVPGGDS